MGLSLSDLRNKSVSLKDIYPLLVESYTVERTSGKEEDKWCIPTYHHQCSGNCADWIYLVATKHSPKDTGKWRIFMRNSEENPNLHACGWRRLETIRPSRLTGEDEIKEWRENTIKILEELEEKRDKSKDEVV